MKHFRPALLLAALAVAGYAAYAATGTSPAVDVPITIVASGGTGACAGVASVFGLTCNPNLSDNFDGNSLNTTLWDNHGYNPNTYQVAGGILTMGLSNLGVEIQCRTNCIPGPLPNNWELRFRFNNFDGRAQTPSAIWTQSNLAQVPPGDGQGSFVAGKQLEIDHWEDTFSGNAARSPEAGLNAWDTTGSTSPYPETQDNNLNCTMTPAGGVPSGGGCFFNNQDFGGNLKDGNFHTLGAHRFVNGSGINQIDYLRDGTVYTSATMNSTYQFLIGLPQTLVIAWLNSLPSTTLDIDYFRVWDTASSTLSPDGATIAGGSGGSLITIAGTWTFDTVVSAAHPGNYSIKLNGVFQGGSSGADPSAANLYILNSGTLYQQTSANIWYSWTGVSGPWTGPVADPRGGGSVPQPAQVAGFTTLIRNDNFQSPSFANPATWLDCAGASAPLYWLAWVGFGSVDGPCGAITQATDPLGGQTALKIHWQDSYYSNIDGPGHTIPIQTTDSSGNGAPTSRGFYIEVVARTDYIGSSAFDSAWMGLWSLTANGSGGPFEIDGFEEATGSSGHKLSSNIHNHAPGVNYDSCAWIVSGSCGGCPPSVGCSFDITQYHTYAWRQTSGGTDVIFCSYIDGALEGCNSVSPNSSQLAGMLMAHQFGVNLNGPNDPHTPLGNGSTGKNAWIKSIRIWSCSTNPNNNCNSSSNNPT